MQRPSNFLDSPWTRACIGIAIVSVVFWALLDWLPYALSGDYA